MVTPPTPQQNRALERLGEAKRRLKAAMDLPQRLWNREEVERLKREYLDRYRDYERER